MELPKEFKGTIYFYYWERHGTLIVARRVSDDPEYILLGTKEVEAEFNVSHDDAVSQLVSNLKQEKTRIQAEAQRRCDEIDDEVNSFLAIPYEVEK